jgi:hypothetical protein
VSFKNVILNLVKLLLGAMAFSVGIMAGDILATLLQLQPPAMPEAMDVTNALKYMLFTSPLLALALALLARGLAGGFIARMMTLSFLTWIAYTVNTQLEASIFSTFATGIWFTLVDFAVPSLFAGAAVALLFPSDHAGDGLQTARNFFRRRSPVDWGWRLVLAALAFMPVYWFFGMLVVPFTADYYRQSMYGLAMPAVEQILMILFIRSVLFLIACLPVVMLWQKSNTTLFASLGFALFVLVGLLYMLAADWMPVSVRLPHTLEIMADEFVYAGLLVALLKEVKITVPWRSARRLKEGTP